MASSRNKTIKLTELDRIELRPKLLTPSEITESITNATILGDTFEALPKLPRQCVDLAIIDPPYNLYKKVGAKTFGKQSIPDYTDWITGLLALVIPTLKPTATLYLCGDWTTSLSLYGAAMCLKLHVRNRITWQRKAPGAKYNYKNAHEDVWFCTVSNKYTFNVVKTRKKVLFPYKHDASDWTKDSSGQAWRDEYPSNMWTDITLPFWSMAENTDHPTQKSEKFSAKLILASSNPGDVVLSPFAGVSTDCVAAKKLGRKYIGIELQEDFALIGQKRLQAADTDSRIQGYHDGVFWERNAGRALPGIAEDLPIRDHCAIQEAEG